MKVSETCLEGVWKVSGRCVDGVLGFWLSGGWWRESGECLAGVWKVSGAFECYLDCVWRVSGKSIQGVWKLDGRCLVGPYWWVSEAFLKGVWRVSGRWVKRVWNVSGRCLEGPNEPVWPHLAMEFICKCLISV